MKDLLRILVLSVMATVPFTAHAADKMAAEPAAKTEQSSPDLAKFDKQLAQVRENMQKMQEQMNKIRETQDPQQRQKLLQEHWTAMQSAMQSMHGMWGAGMMGCCMGNGMMMGDHMMGGAMMGWNDMSGYYAKLTPEQIKQRQYMMDQYMPMQQMMMDHMMWHQNWVTQPTQTPAQ